MAFLPDSYQIPKPEFSGIYQVRKSTYTANVCRELQGLYREIGEQGFQNYGDCMYTRNPCNF